MKVTRYALILAFLSFALSAFGHDDNEQVLEELQKLTATVQQLEKRIMEMEAAISNGVVVTSSSDGGASAEVVADVMEEVYRQEESVKFPWMDAEKWASIDKGMSPEEVVQVLGEPTLEDPSLNKRIDLVYTYRGNRPGSGKKVVAKVRFYKGKVVSFEAP